jgi:hypothetical protein
LQRARFDTLQQDNERLRLEFARLTDELARRGGDCAAGIVVPGGVVVGSIDGKPIERGAAPDANAPGLNVTTKPDEKGAADKGPNDKDANKDQGNGPPPQDQQGQNKQMADKEKNAPKPMVVPPDAKQKQELGFLKGDWRSRTGLATPTGEKDLRPSYTLDDKGKGKVSFVQHNGTTCEAPAEARWDGGKLVIEEKANPKCADGRTYARNIVNCEVDKDGVAQCKGSQPGDQRSYSVQIGR